MTDAPVTLSQAEFNGDIPPENGKPLITEAHEAVSGVESTPPYFRVEPSLADSLTEGNGEESGKLQGKKMLNWSMDEKILKGKTEENLFTVHKAITDLSLEETSVDEMTFREGHQWEKIPLSGNNKKISGQKERIIEQPLEEREDKGGKNIAYQATEIEWLGSQKPRQVDVVREEEQEVWDEEINNEDDDEDEVRVIEFKKKHEEGSPLKEEGDPSEDSPPSSSSSQPVTPDEQPAFGKKGDISRSTYSRYNTISYRKIRKGNTKQRIDEFESMMHL